MQEGRAQARDAAAERASAASALGPPRAAAPGSRACGSRVWVSASEQLGEGAGVTWTSSRDAPGLWSPEAPTASRSLSRGSWTEASWSKMLRAQITGLASRPSNLFPTRGTKPRPALSVWRASLAAHPTRFLPPPARRPSCCSPRSLALAVVPTAHLLTDTHFTSSR